MNWDKAIEMLEEGGADMVVLTALVMRSGNRVWLSFDGKEWEETESKLVNKQI